MPTKNHQKTLKKPSAAPEILKNPQKTFPRPPKTFKKPSPETFLLVLAFKSHQRRARALARAPPLVPFWCQNLQKCFQGGFFEGLRGAREGFLRVFQKFRGRRRVFLGFLEGFLPASEKVAKQCFLKVFWEILGSQSLAGEAHYNLNAVHIHHASRTRRGPPRHPRQVLGGGVGGKLFFFLRSGTP